MTAADKYRPPTYSLTLRNQRCCYNLPTRTTSCSMSYMLILTASAFYSNLMISRLDTIVRSARKQIDICNHKGYTMVR